MSENDRIIEAGKAVGEEIRATGNTGERTARSGLSAGSFLRIYVSAVLAGICIGLGGTVYLSLESRVLGALFFTVGLFTICTFGLHLFTGKVCYCFREDAAYRRSLPVIWLGNLTGTAILAGILRLTRLRTLTQKALELSQGKLEDGLQSLFLLAVLCNIFIYIAVEGFRNNPHETGKYLSLFFGVMVFILCGFEHCVADMFYFSLAGVWGVRAALCLMVITLGNAAGGVLSSLVRDWLGRPS